MWARRALTDEGSGGGGLLFSPGIVARRAAARWAASWTLSGNRKRGRAARPRAARRRGFRPRSLPRACLQGPGIWGGGGSATSERGLQRRAGLNLGLWEAPGEGQTLVDSTIRFAPRVLFPASGTMNTKINAAPEGLSMWSGDLQPGLRGSEAPRARWVPRCTDDLRPPASSPTLALGGRLQPPPTPPGLQCGAVHELEPRGRARSPEPVQALRTRFPGPWGLQHLWSLSPRRWFCHQDLAPLPP